MLTSVGKLSSIGEMLTIKLAASNPPVDRHANCFDSLVVSDHFAGTVKEIPCWSHLICCPPARAANCAGLASPCSAVAPPVLSLDDDEELVPDELFDLSLLVKLHNDKVKPKTKMTGRYFISADSKMRFVRTTRLLQEKGNLSQFF